LSLAFAANTTAAEERGIENGGEERGRRSFGRRFDFQQRERPRRQTFSSGSSVECGGEQKKKEEEEKEAAECWQFNETPSPSCGIDCCCLGVLGPRV
jgi:hypothetical protein